MGVNITSIGTSSNGIWEGDNPLHFAFPLLIVQTTLILLLTRLLSLLFKPLRQPTVIAEIVGGIVLGPSAFGRNKTYMNAVFPKWSTPILESVASIGLLFFLFLVGLELDLNSIRRSGRRAFYIAAAGISVPFLSGAGVAVLFRKTIHGADKVGYSQFLVFMGVALSITAFPVLARILAELKLLTTRVGETAMAAAAFNDVAAWILLALAIALAGNGEAESHKSPIISVWVLLSGAGFVVVMAVAVRPVIVWVARRCSSEQESNSSEAYIGLTLAFVLVSGFVTDLIGIHSIFGAFVFGVMIPKEGGFSGKLMGRIEELVGKLLLPLYFASSGLKTDVATIRGATAWGLLVLVITVACAGKIVGTFVVAVLSGIPHRESITLGFLMNTKGLVELIVLNIGREKKVLNDEMFAILVLMALFTTFITTPTVMAIYKPARPGHVSTRKRKLQLDNVDGNSTGSANKNKNDIRVLGCLHGPGNAGATISLTESIRSTAESKLKLYAMHLIELTERSSSIVLVQRLRRNGLPFIGRRGRGGAGKEVRDQVAYAFEAYGRLGQVTVRPISSISPLATMHQDICHVAEEKEVAMILLPFHKTWLPVEDGEGAVTLEENNAGHGWRGVNQRVLKHAPCSVAVLVDRGLGLEGRKGKDQKVCVMFFGGPDDREALEIGTRMAERHPTVKVEVVRFMVDLQGTNIGLLPSPEKNRESSYSFSVAAMNREKETSLDEAALGEFRKRREGTAEYIEREAGNLVEDVLSIGRSGGYDLIVVGKGRFPSTMVAGLAELPAEHAELGPVGDILTSSDNKVPTSVLIVQQHDLAHVEEVPVSKILQNDKTEPGVLIQSPV